MKGISWLRYVRHHLVEDYLQLGWMVIADMGPHGGQYCIIMKWSCTCPMVEPKQT
jgi:hypothetical protein